MQSVFLLAPFLILTPGANDPEDAKERFLTAYEPAVKRVTDRLTKKCRMVVQEQSFEHGKPVAKATLEFLANDRCIRVKTTETSLENKENRPTLIAWHLLRPDGVYVIHEAKKPGEYLLFRMNLGNSTATAAGWPFTDMATPLMRFNHFLLSHIRKPDVKILHFGEHVKDGDEVRELKVSEKINNFSFVSTYYFDTSEDWLGIPYEKWTRG